MRALWFLVFSVFAKTGEGRDYEDFEAFERLSKKQQDEYPPRFVEPVPFGHITKEGFGDPFSLIKPPLDPLEMILRTPKDEKEAIEVLEKTKRTNLMFLNQNIPKNFGRPNPKDELLLERFINPPPETNHTMLKWYDLPTIQARNAMLPPKKQFIAKKKAEPGPPPMMSPRVSKLPFFAKDTFELANDKPEMPVNWTTCDEFAIGAVFSPKDIVNLKWTPFYVWQTDIEIDVATEHTFEYPSNKLVNEYHAKYNKMLNKTIDWTKAKLLMKGIGEALLIAADKRGLFHSVVKHEIPDVATDLLLPSLTLRMKIEDPYLVMTSCEKHYATLMAVSGNEPTDVKEMHIEAATVKFKGPGKPVWRDYEAEKETLKSIREAKLRDEKDKIIVINEELPHVGQWD